MRLLKKENKQSIFDILICLVIVFIIFLPSLNRPWLFYDEGMIYEEIAVPIPSYFGEIFEIIKNFGLTNNLSSSNYLYTTNTVTRANLFGAPLLLTLEYLFKNNAVLYHLLNLFLHLANTVLVFLILKFIISDSSLLKRILVISLSLIWAIHPVQVESILLSTNIGATLSYFVFFFLFFDFIKNKENNVKLYRKIILPIAFLIPMLLNEYIIALPLILFAYSLINNLKNKNLQNSIKITFNETLPYILGVVIYAIYFIFSTYKFSQTSTINSFTLTFERIFWLFPQIFFHYLKLIFFPKALSIDQTSFVKIGGLFFDPYSIFCIIFTLFWILLPITIFTRNKKTFPILVLSSLFFLSLLPFSQVFSQTYCLSAERYLYTPIFFIIFGITLMTAQINIQKIKPIILILIFFILIPSCIRTYIRMLDWKDNATLLKSTIKTLANPLYLGARLFTFAEIIHKTNPDESNKYYKEAERYYYQAYENLIKEKNKRTNEPFILKAYGLDINSLIIKSIYSLSLKSLLHNKDPRSYLTIFKLYSNSINNFDPKALEIYANLLIKNNQIEDAKNVFLLAYKKYPTNPFILLSLIRFEREIEKNLTNTRKYLFEALKLYPYSKEILFETLRYYQLAQDLSEYAKHSYLYGLRTHSKFHYLEALAGFLMLDKLSDAQKSVDKLLFLDRNDPKVIYFASSYYYQIKDYNKALNYLNEAFLIVQNTNDKDLAFKITNALSHVYLSAGNYQQSTYFAKEALNFAKDNPINLKKVKETIRRLGI